MIVDSYDILIKWFLAEQ